MHQIADIFGLLVIATIAATVVGSPNTKGDVNALFKGFTEAEKGTRG